MCYIRAQYCANTALIRNISNEIIFLKYWVYYRKFCCEKSIFQKCWGYTWSVANDELFLAKCKHANTGTIVLPVLPILVNVQPIQTMLVHDCFASKRHISPKYLKQRKKVIYFQKKRQRCKKHGEIKAGKKNTFNKIIFLTETPTTRWCSIITA